jgi:hypothetical protein
LEILSYRRAFFNLAKKSRCEWIWKPLKIFFNFFLINITYTPKNRGQENHHIRSQGTWGTAYRCQCLETLADFFWSTRNQSDWSTTVKWKRETVIATSPELSHLSGKESAAGCWAQRCVASFRLALERTIREDPEKLATYRLLLPAALHFRL